MPEQTIQERLAGVWESNVHDGNGEHVTAVFLNVSRQMMKEGAPGSELPERVMSAAFQAPDESDDGDGTGVIVWLLMSQAVSAMAGEYRKYLGERRESAGGVR